MTTAIKNNKNETAFQYSLVFIYHLVGFMS